MYKTSHKKIIKYLKKIVLNVTTHKPTCCLRFTVIAEYFLTTQQFFFNVTLTSFPKFVSIHLHLFNDCAHVLVVKKSALFAYKVL
jgi:hypothetical protein